MARAKSIHFLVLFMLALTWGSSFILMQRGLLDEADKTVFSPSQVAALRMTIASLVLLPVSITAFRKIKWSDWKWLLIVGVVGSGAPAFLFAYAQKGLNHSSSVAGILNALTPLFTLLVGITIFNRRIGKMQAAGVFIGLVGAILLISLKGFGNTANWKYSLLIALATLFYGISVNTISSKLSHIPALKITALALLIAGIPYSVYLFSTDFVEIVRINPHGMHSLGFICILAIAGTAVANMLYFWLTLETSPIFASSVTYLMPLVAVGWGIADGEQLTVLHFLCALVILAGVWLVNKK